MRFYFPEHVIQSMKVPDFGITWAGPNPLAEGFCLGSETGCLALTNTEGRLLSGLVQASPSGEAINGVAFSQNWLSVTTRKDINFIEAPRPNAEDLEAVVISGGATDVTVARSGYFVIPLGRGGIMFAKPGTRENDPVMISKPRNQDVNFCRVIALAGEKGTDLIVSAGRRGGLGFTDFREDYQGHLLQSVKFNEIDIVDVCSIGTAEKPMAVAAAGRDGALVFVRDIRTDKNPLTLKFNGVKGTVYRILSAGEDIYLLTSSGLFALFGLADTVRQGQSVGEVTTGVLRIPIEAADANIVDQKWLLAVGVDALFRIDVRGIPRSPEESTIAERAGKAESLGVEGSWGGPSVAENLDVRPMWGESGFEQSFERMAPVG